MRTFLRMLAVMIIVLESPASAQLKGTHLLGDVGLKSGSQAPPGFSLVVPVYLYNTGKLRNDNGDVITDNVDLNMFITGIGGAWVFNKKILGGKLGGTVLFPFASNRISSNLTNTKHSLAFTDIYFQPVQLGWEVKQADFIFSYALYFPAGKYEPGADDNTGLGMLSNEFAAGSTVYFDQKKTIHFSGLFSYAVNGKKRDSEVKAGNLLTIEGGLGKTWYKKAIDGPIPVIINAGLVYYFQFKSTADEVPVGSEIVSLGGDKDKMFGLGPEANIYLPGLRSQLGFRWLGEIMARNRFQGNTFMLTIAYNVKSFTK
ncbi:SphA family protein [Chitinophaga barathri]|uniref:Transporter n=1 Tax=Chitinophaga barathri TaxID=1647451 RepID=A0A3N4MHA0_9BACT|nr:transporter [Chitinophaga barathri]RPD39019.1 transporter [Chitinophaga barathri]